MFNLDPKGYVSHAGIRVPVILCHKDSNDLGLGSAHGDVMHWFKRYNKTMEDVRNDVATILKSKNPIAVKPKEEEQPKPTTPTNSEIYRIRKEWTLVSTQVGAYRDLEAAKKALAEFGNEYKLFDSNGKVVYELPKKITRPTYSTVSLGYANLDENNKLNNGAAGDQTKKEIYIKDWQNEQWTVVLRPNDNKIAEKIAYACEDACLNEKIGYDISNRNSIYIQAKKVKFDLSKITTACECDSGSLVSTCCVAAGLDENIFYAGSNCRYTSNLKAACEQTKAFTVLIDKAYLTGKDYLKRGDIILSNSQSAIVLSNGTKYNQALPVAFKPYVIKVTANALNVRSGPGTNYKINSQIRKGGIYTIVEEKNGFGKLKSGAGWVSLQWVKKL